MKPRELEAVPRITLTREEAALSLGLSLTSFEKHVQPDLKLIRAGSCRLVEVTELRDWAKRNSSLAAPRRAA